MNSKEIKKIKNLMLKDREKWLDKNSDTYKKYKEMSLREMIMSCLTYKENIFKSVDFNSMSKYYQQPYINEYIDILGYDRVMEVYNEQKNYFDNHRVAL